MVFRLVAITLRQGWSIGATIVMSHSHVQLTAKSKDCPSNVIKARGRLRHVSHSVAG
jgi:hypothetical protein